MGRYDMAKNQSYALKSYFMPTGKDTVDEIKCITKQGNGTTSNGV